MGLTMTCNTVSLSPFAVISADFQPDGAARASAVVDDDLLSPRGTQLLRECPRRDVGAAAGRYRHYQADGLVRVNIVGVNGRRRETQHGNQAKSHGIPW